MNKSESEKNFREAGSLYQQRHYQEALTLLVELDRVHPNTRRVLYPMALCLAKLEQYTEAMQLTDRLILEFEYGPARKLHAGLQESMGPVGLTGLAELDLGLSEGLQESTGSVGLPGLAELDLGLSAGSSFGSGVGPPVIAMESFTSKYFNLILVAVFLAVLAMFAYFWELALPYQEWLEARRQQPDAPVPVASFIYNIALNLFLLFFGLCVGAYCGLAVVQALPEDEFNDNLKDIALYVLYGTLLLCIPVIGWIAILIVIYRHYDLRFGSLIVTVFVCFIIAIVVFFGLAFFIGLVAWLLLP